MKLVNAWKINELPDEYKKVVIESRPCHFPLPMEIVPRFIKDLVNIQFWPHGRYWELRKYVHNNSYLDYDQLYALGNFLGTSLYNEVILIEIWENDGDDGHTNYRRCGYALLEEESPGEQNKLDNFDFAKEVVSNYWRIWDHNEQEKQS